MSERIGNVVIIAPEEEETCTMCNKVAELRPYGPDYSRICFECAMKDKEGTEKRMKVKLFGDEPKD